MAKDIDDVIDEFLDPNILDLDAVIRWANLLGVEVNYPPIDDLYPDWEGELRVEVGEAMRKVGEKPSKCPKKDLNNNG